MRLIDADELKNKIKVIRSVGGGELRYITEADIDNASTVIPEMRNDIWTDIERLSELRSNYNCFDEKEEPYYRALSNAIQALRDKAK